MTTCCTKPAESAEMERRKRPCPRCGHEGQAVERRTIEALLKPDIPDALNGGPYWFCQTRDCPIVYYGADGAQIAKEQLRIRVGLKETEDPILVCYCFGVTERMIQEETQRTGRPSASARIRAEVKKGNRRCEVENPSGRCCLGEVLQAEKRAIAALASGAAPVTPPNSGIVASSAGGLLAAVLASLCCLGPVALGALGVGVGATGLLVDMAGFLKGLVPYRPLFIGITVGLMGMSVYLAYRRPAANTSCPTCLSAQAARGRLLLWIVVGLAVVLVLAPYWLAFVTGE